MNRPRLAQGRPRLLVTLAVATAWLAAAGCTGSENPSPPKTAGSEAAKPRTRPDGLYIETAEVATAPGASGKASAPATTPPTPQELTAMSKQFDEVSKSQFDTIRPQVAEKIGPGTGAGAISLGPGVLFSSIPLNRLVEEEGPGAAADTASRGIESLTRKGDIRKIYPIDHNSRVVASMMLRMNAESGQPVADRLNPGGSNLFAQELQYARDLHSRATNTPLDAYKGVSFYGVNKHFLYVEKEGKQEMIPLEPDPSLGFVRGKGLAAEEVLKKLGELVRKRAASKAEGPS
ncbi:MAG: hypothetical protein U0835_13285 [Isosphaeraceae bacterium]